jgi:hypothetical protein
MACGEPPRSRACGPDRCEHFWNCLCKAGIPGADGAPSSSGPVAAESEKATGDGVPDMARIDMPSPPLLVGPAGPMPRSASHASGGSGAGRPVRDCDSGNLPAAPCRPARFTRIAPHRLALLAAGLVAVLGTADATEPRARDDAGPIWNWREHEAPRDTVQSREAEAGTAPSTAQARRDAEEVDRLYRDLTRCSPGAPLEGPSPPARREPGR